ncbi:MAG: condensation domain-containing protein, partial [Gammaproteobacteria bacterium]|nr:condensation domain-containing protein [Gammaproteobacteria bacterium]
HAAVDVHANFFDLGGHSLLATQLIARIRDTLNVELPLSELFASPTVAGLAQYIAAADTDVDLQVQRIVQRAEKAVAPASFMQQRLWLLDQLDSGNPVYNLAWSVLLEGALDEPALREAIVDVIDRHEVLRTRIVGRDGEPVQLIESRAHVDIQFEAMCDPSDADIRARFRALARQAFDLSRGPLLRVTVLRTGASRAVLLLVVHHIVADGWSLSVLFRELASAYNARRRGAAPDWPALPVQYADYAVWQRAWLSGARLTRQLDYWRAQLAGAPATLGLATDRPRPAVQTHRGAWLTRRLDADLTTRLRGLARDQDVTLFMLLVAAYGAVLGRYAGAEDVVIGTPIAGRQRTELEGLIGFFVNTLALRIDLSGNPAFATLLARVKHTALDAYAHQDLPFEKLVDALNPPRDTSRTPVFQVMFNLHNEPEQKLQLDGLHVTRFGTDRKTAKFDLSLAVSERVDGLFCNLEYNTDLYDEVTVSALLSSFTALLSRVSGDAQVQLGSVFSGDAAAVSAAAPLMWAGSAVAGFYAQAATRPTALAVSDGGRHTSYGTLADHARGVAAAVHAAVGAGQRIGVLGDYAAPLVAGVLGTLTAGCAYVPLDPSWPAARLAQVSADAQLALVLADAAQATRAATLGVAVRVLEQIAPAPAAPAVTVTATTPAYLIYTSGSTGTPRGVVQTHGGLLQQVTRYAARLALNDTDRLSGLSGYAFDAAVQDLFGALLHGGSLHPVSAQSPDALDALVRDGVTVLHATPTVYRQLLGGTVNCTQDLSAVRWVVLGGEAMRGADVTLYRTRFGRGTRLLNGLGLTESTLALQYVLDAGTRLWGRQVPVGRAVPGLTVTLEDASGRAGWCGEIVLRGAGIASGYWRDAAATRARFMVEDGAVVGYRTGDLGWRRPDGEVVYRGRRDGQFKLRGVRIERGEVEHALLACPGVVACAVTLDTRRADDVRLVAYVAGVSGPAAVAELRSQLQATLPAYLVPQALVGLAALPRLGNGKVDYAALPAPVWGTGPVVAADGALQAQLAGLWAEVLGLDTVGVTADFFALGGHSLLATRLIARVRDALGVEVPLITLFEHPTVQGMAASIATLVENGQTQDLPEMIRQTRNIRINTRLE